VAVDSAAKRASALGIGLVFTLLVVPDSTIAQSDRQTIAHSYSGIAADAPDVNTPDCYVGFDGEVSGNSAYQGLIDSSNTGFTGLIDGSGHAAQGLVYGNKAFNGIINPDDVGFEGEITGSEGFEGDICGC
jgi:hypothetical protein